MSCNQLFAFPKTKQRTWGGKSVLGRYLDLVPRAPRTHTHTHGRSGWGALCLHMSSISTPSRKALERCSDNSLTKPLSDTNQKTKGMRGGGGGRGRGLSQFSTPSSGQRVQMQPQAQKCLIYKKIHTIILELYFNIIINLLYFLF